MFVRKETKQVRNGTLVVPFCKDCNSQEIETIQTCKQCGSHNITSDWTDKRSQKIEYSGYETSIYKCDCCGKEYEGRKDDHIMSYVSGEFDPYKYSPDPDYPCIEDYTNYNLGVDLCKRCKQKFIDTLTAQLSFLTSESHIADLIDIFISKNKKE